MQAVGQGDPKHLHWYHLGFRAVSGHLGPPPAGIWAGDIGMSSWRGTSEATTTGSDPDGCSKVLGSLSLEYVVGLGKMVFFMAQAVGNLRLVSFCPLIWREQEVRRAAASSGRCSHSLDKDLHPQSSSSM